ncbi:MAG: sensor histidine kinase [Anaerolineae bacterium]|nr:sensor histidine kinase [Anaerolineae bacterium]
MTVFRDLSQHILDIAENSVAAEADVLHIDIAELPEADRLSIVVRDDGRGMTPDVVARVTDPWVTTRTTRKVGLGIPFLKQTAEMCGGEFEITSNPRGMHAPAGGTTTRAVFQLSHIDRPPLGDVIGTLLCVVVGNPQLDVVYHHRVGDEAFEFDTREIREILGDDVPLSDPEVLAFIRGTLTEGLAAIGGEAAPEPVV